MKSMKKLVIFISIASATAFSGGVFAQATMDHSKMGDVNMMVSNDMTQGEVRKIDKEVKEVKKITIKHGEIKNLEMPPMTMVFQVRDPALLEKVQAGDKVQFKAIKDSGALVVTDLQLVK
ncbi:MAG: copper-binding protein [Rhodoferax sp.]|uniref:copper-binding protein n=1 Tax=Rhodoferax sp. TaxID=50421 RepID=UPI0018176B70|nr:copper-binding protein [Rhodoferax sp.]NMM19823.1 copper-binding protein [Rhodoferax sp.]